VFSQFNNDGKGNYTELARKNIDTGAGLERLASISQDVPTDFDTDGFLPAIQVLETLSESKYDINSYFSKNQAQLNINHDFKVIVDHIKANIFAIADGALPSNKERGSILRRLIRRALICSRRLIIKNDFIEVLVKKIIQINANYYPYLLEQQSHIIDIINQEAVSFTKTLKQGYELFQQTLQNKEINTESIFKLVDTYGFPFEIIHELALERGIEINEAAYLERLEKHKEISRANLETKGMDSQNNELVNFTLASSFDYDLLEINHAEVIACFDTNFNRVEHFSGKG
jgi:alanyl-tRNA synthetase